MDICVQRKPPSQKLENLYPALPVWDITWMSGQVHALGQVDGSTCLGESCCADLVMGQMLWPPNNIGAIVGGSLKKSLHQTDYNTNMCFEHLQGYNA